MLLTVNCDAHHPDAWALLEYGIANARKAGARPRTSQLLGRSIGSKTWLRDRGRGTAENS
jgi:hypothetical protein